MLFNAKAAEHVAVLGVTKPDAQGAGAVASGWIPLKNFIEYMAVLMMGDLGSSATVAMKLQHASDGSGTGAEDITGKVTATYTQAGTDYSNKQAVLSLRPEESVGALLSFKDGTATHFKAVTTVAVATSDVAGIVLGFGPRVQPVADVDVSTVVAIG